MARSSIPWQDRSSITPEEAGQLLSLSRSTVIAAIRRGEIVGEQIGGRYLVNVAALKARFAETAGTNVVPMPQQERKVVGGHRQSKRHPILFPSDRFTPI